MSTLQSKNKLTSVEPREVFDLMRWMPGIPFIASSMGRVTETSVCGAGATPLSTMMTMRGKLVAGKIAIGSCQAANNPPAQTRAIMTRTARDWLETMRARFTVLPPAQASVASENKFPAATHGFSILSFRIFRLWIQLKCNSQSQCDAAVIPRSGYFPKPRVASTLGRHVDILLNPERVAPVGRNRVAVELVINSVTQGSRGGNPGL